MNETNFRIECDRAYTIITLETSKRLIFTNANNRDYIISIECVDVDNDDYALLAFLIVTSK